MPSVKQLILALALISLASGCSNLDLARFAPPGIVKYEDLAGDQPPNPEIQERISERRTDPEAKYPILSQTPGESDRPEFPPAEDRAMEAETLVSQRNALEASIDEDRASAEAAQKEAELLPLKRDALKEETDRDAAEAARYKAEIGDDLGADLDQGENDQSAEPPIE